ncbi:MAG: serine/threonine protein kinase [Firmicutes bacterium]|nr:serine/threonine protein kinase [Bacillota bacterium]
MKQFGEGFIEFEHSIDNDIIRQIKVAKIWDSPLFRDFLINIEEHLGQGQVIHDYRNVLIRIDQNEELGLVRELLVKKYKLLRRYDQFRFRFLASKAHRSLTIALFLLEKGLNTPAPIGVIEDRDRFNRLLNCYYLTEYLNYDTSFAKVINETDVNQKSKFLTEAARNIRLMHDSGIIHNDLHASNILIKQIATHPNFYFIDLNRARKRNTLSLKDRAKDLGRLALQQQDRLIFFKSYDPQNALWLRLRSHQVLAGRKKWMDFKRKIRHFKSKFS